MKACAQVADAFNFMKKLICLWSILVIFLPHAVLAEDQSNNTVLITEIQTEGTTSTDEFVEIYNYGTLSVNLTGWRLSKKTASGTESNLLTSFPATTLAPGAFLLLMGETFSGGQSADLKYSTKSSIANDNTVVLYSDAGKTVVNLVGFGAATAFNGSPATNPDKTSSIQRKFSGGHFSDSKNNLNDFIVASPTPDGFTTGETSVINPPPNAEPPPQTEDNGSGASPPPNPLETAPEAAPAQPDTEPATSFFDRHPELLATSSPVEPDILFNEIFPNPTGPDHDEFIELKNFGNQVADLTFWQIQTSSGIYVFDPDLSSSHLVAPEGILVLRRSDSGLALANSKNTLKLIDGNKKVVDKVSYTDAAEGVAFARHENTDFWHWTSEPTPGQENIYVRPKSPPVADIEITSNPAGEETKLDGSDSIDPDGGNLKFDWRIFKGKTVVFSSQEEIVGKIFEESGNYSAKLTVIDPDGQKNMVTKKFKIDVADESDDIQAQADPTENKSTDSGDKLKDAAGGQTKAAGINSQAAPINGEQKTSNLAPSTTQKGEPKLIGAAELKKFTGQWVSIKGTVSQANKKNFFLFDETGEVQVQITPGEKFQLDKKLKAGAKLTVAGLAAVDKKEIVLRPDSTNDFNFLEEKKAEPLPIITAPDNKKYILPAIYAILAILLLGGWLLQKKLSKPAPKR